MEKLQLSEKEIQYIVEQLQKGKKLPEDLKYKLFPVKQKEYELAYGGKMRKEDILANEDGVFPVPLQVGKVFNGKREAFKDGWRNMIVFGDNLQFLKTIYENKESLIKDKVKGKVKLIYIDPPFGTGDEYDGNKGQKGYSAKAKGSEFVEFLRRRLIVAKEILANDGVIMVRQGYNFGHYIKTVLDEIFGKENFKNEIIINRTGRPTESIKSYHTTHDTIYFYSKSGEYLFNNAVILRDNPKWRPMHLPGIRFTKIPSKYHHLFSKENLIEKNGKIVSRARIILGKELLPPNGRHWALNQDAIFEAEKGNKIRLNKKNGNPEAIEGDFKKLGDNWTDIPGYSKYYDYPTENSEVLLKRVIETSSNKNDLTLDFFSGSGTTAAVAEKLGRRWIVCDIGKLSFYTMQKRLLNINKSKGLENPKKKYKKSAKTFITVNTGYYDLQKVFELKRDEYCKFVMNLFEVEPFNKKIGGISIEGQKKDGFYCLIYPYWKFKDSSVDEDYLEDLHSHIGNKIGSRLYIIAPANYVDFISDYYEIGKVKYYFLKVPYQIIKELHKVNFKKFRQPQRKSNINDLEDAVGFHFIRQPQVKSKLVSSKNQIIIHIQEFYSDYTEEESGNDMDNFESLAMVLIDRNYKGEAFEMDDYFFAEDLLPNKNKKSDESEEDLKKELKQQKEIIIPLNKKDCGEKIMIVYIDIYGNEFKESLRIR